MIAEAPTQNSLGDLRDLIDQRHARVLAGQELSEREMRLVRRLSRALLPAAPRFDQCQCGRGKLRVKPLCKVCVKALQRAETAERRCSHCGVNPIRGNNVTGVCKDCRDHGKKPCPDCGEPMGVLAVACLSCAPKHRLARVRKPGSKSYSGAMKPCPGGCGRDIHVESNYCRSCTCKIVKPKLGKSHRTALKIPRTNLGRCLGGDLNNRWGTPSFQKGCTAGWGNLDHRHCSCGRPVAADERFDECGACVAKALAKPENGHCKLCGIWMGPLGQPSLHWQPSLDIPPGRVCSHCQEDSHRLIQVALGTPRALAVHAERAATEQHAIPTVAAIAV